MTSKWHKKCPRKDSRTTNNFSCNVGIASSTTVLGKETNSFVRDDNVASDPFKSNCYHHERVASDWVPQLEAALKALPKAVAN